MVEAISKIKEAEEKSALIIQKANIDAQEIKLNTEQKEKEKHELAIKNTKLELEEKLSNKTKELENELSSFVQDANIKAQEIIQDANNKSFDVVYKILEDIIR